MNQFELGWEDGRKGAIKFLLECIREEGWDITSIERWAADEMKALDNGRGR